MNALIPLFQVFKLVSAELCLEFVESISHEQTRNLLTDIAAKTGIKWIESAHTFIMSGTFKQVEESSAFLQQGIHQSSGVVVVDKLKGEAIRSHRRGEREFRFDDEAEKEGEANPDSSIFEAAMEAICPEERTNETHSDHMSSFSSDYPEIQSFEIEPKIVKAFFKSHKNKLDDIEANFKVEMPKQPVGKKVSLKPKKGCSAEEYDEACNLFIELYQNMYQVLKMERFSLKSGKTTVHSRETIAEAGKKFPISIEVCKDRKHWEMYGEASHIEEALKYLEQEGVETKRETEMAMDEDGRRRTKQNEERMPKDVCAEIMFDALEEFARQCDPAKKTITEARFVNIDEPKVVAFGEAFMNRYAEKLVRGTPGGDLVRFSPTGAEGGSSTAPSSSLNRGRNNKKNVANKRGSSVKPMGGAECQNKHNSFGSLGANNSDPLGAYGNASPPNALYSGVVKGNAVDKGAPPPIVQQLGHHEGKGGFSLPTVGDKGKKDKKEEGKCNRLKNFEFFLSCGPSS